GGMTRGHRHHRAPHRAPVPLLEPERDRKQPPHPRVEAVDGPEQRERRPGPELAGHDGKQNESEDASPPSSRTWCGRMPSSISRKNRGSSAIPPSGRVSSLTIHPRIPSG